MVRALALAIAVTLAPYPAQHQGGGHEPTRATVVFAGTSFVPRSALVDYEIGASCCPSKTVGNVNVFVFEHAGVTCRRLDAAKSSRFFSYTVETDGKRLPVGHPPPTAFFQQASFNVLGHTTGFQPGVNIVFTRVDTSPAAKWHGRIHVPRNSFQGKSYAFNGSFAATWCGTSRS